MLGPDFPGRPGTSLPLLDLGLRRENGGQGSLPAVIPVVLYHGSLKWKIPLNFASLYRAPESVKGSLWDFNYTLCDLSAYADEEIKLGVMARIESRYKTPSVQVQKRKRLVPGREHVILLSVTISSGTFAAGRR